MVHWEPRFWAKVEKTDYCWLWVGSKDKDGYGLLKLDGQARKAHRLSYALHNGPIPKGQRVDHRCFVHNCVNPAHLRSATHKQNLENRQGATRASKSGIRGVCWNARYGRWLATVKHHGKQVYREMFDSAEEAEREVIKARQRIFTHNEVDRIA